MSDMRAISVTLHFKKVINVSKAAQAAEQSMGLLMYQNVFQVAPAKM